MFRGVLKHSNRNRKPSPFWIKKEIEGWEVRLNNWRIKLKNGDVPVFSLGKPTLLFGSTSSRGWKCPVLGAGTSRVSHRWSLIKQFSHCHTRTEAEAGRESGPRRPHVATACPRLSTGYSTSPIPFLPFPFPGGIYLLSALEDFEPWSQNSSGAHPSPAMGAAGTRARERLSTAPSVLGTRRSSCCWSHCWERHRGKDRWVHEAKSPRKWLFY